MADVQRAYELAVEQYAESGVNAADALRALERIPLSIHCWQGDDVGGFERPDAALGGGGIQVTGNYPGKARTVQELRADLSELYSLLPGKHRLNLHASYGEFGGRTVDRDEIEPSHYDGWISWCREHGLGLDFNSTFFSHPRADDGFTLSSKDSATREFWMEHLRRARAVSAHIGAEVGSTCIHDIWLPDGMKDYPADRLGLRETLTRALDEVFQTEYPAKAMKDALESKLFGIGSEAFVVGSHEFYMGYALTRNKMICIDSGHFHPMEVIADKISSLLLFTDELLLHVSRPMRWDSDHIVLFNDELRMLCQEIVRTDRINDIHIGLDFFDATLNRVGAWAIGARSTLKGLLAALLEPKKRLVEAEEAGDYFTRLALLEEQRTLPLGAVWDHYCENAGVPTDAELIARVTDYEKRVLRARR